MDVRPHDVIKHREIGFCPLHPDPRQAQSAVILLSDVDGIHHLDPRSDHLLHLRYDVTVITLWHIETALMEVGFHLDNSLLARLRRSLHYYAEDTQRLNLGVAGDDHTRKVYAHRYHQLPHGCRDGRPEHWRKYL